jgi:membrane dipeptidase
MHLVRKVRGRLLRLLLTARGRTELTGIVRAWLVGLASRFGNYRSFSSGSRLRMKSLRKGDVRVVLSVLYQFFDELAFPYPQAPERSYLKALLDQIEVVEHDIRENHRRTAVVVKNPAALATALEEGKVAFVHCVEGGFHLGANERDIEDAVTKLAGEGVAYITIAHLLWRKVATNANALPFMSDARYDEWFPQPAEGLSSLGRAAVRAMVREGVLIDISHMSDRSIDDTFKLLDQELDPEKQVPVIATHTCFRFGKQHYGLTEETLLRIKARKGVAGLIMAQHQMRDGIRDKRTFRFKTSWPVIRAHIERFHAITGSHEYTAIGSDFDGFIKPTMGGLERAADMTKLTKALNDEYGAAATRMIASGNAQRVLQAGWRGA